MSEQFLAEVKQRKIVAIVRLEAYTHAVEVARALSAGGITMVEFTLTGTGAYEAIQKTRTTLGDRVIVGVGTVLTVEQAEASLAAGSQFAVTPAVRPDVIRTYNQAGVPIISGAFTPTEILTAYEAGADIIKLFPSRLVGPQYLRDVRGPLPHIPFIPTGGISPETAKAYLQAGAVGVGIGGNLVSEQAVRAQDWDAITRNARACVEAIE
jgi:2-dehydro-3-deoxyphosphogluconate aldolase/(4S)-4-hydroxy-2-oxoglutarate aldolase